MVDCKPQFSSRSCFLHDLEDASAFELTAMLPQGVDHFSAGAGGTGLKCVAEERTQAVDYEAKKKTRLSSTQDEMTPPPPTEKLVKWSVEQNLVEQINPRA